MADYEKQLPNGMWLVKRGYAYYIYASAEDFKRDDEEVSHNIDRLNNGNEVFNRAYHGSGLFRSRRMSDVREFLKEMERS